MTFPAAPLVKGTGGNSCDGDCVGDEAVDSGNDSIGTLGVSRGSLLAHLTVAAVAAVPSCCCPLFSGQFGLTALNMHCTTGVLLVLVVPAT